MVTAAVVLASGVASFPIGAVATVILTILGIAAVIGAAIGIFKSNDTKEAAEAAARAADTWRSEADAQEARADRLEAQVSNLTASMKALNERITVLEADKSRLEDMVTSRAEIQALSDQEKHHHGEVMAAVLTLGATLNGGVTS